MQRCLRRFCGGRFDARVESLFASRLQRKGYACQRSGRDEDSSSSAGESHWLSKYFPNQEKWLLEQAEAFYLKGLSQMCKEESKLDEEFVLAVVREKYAGYLSKHKHRVVDSRSRTHLQQASLALSTYKSLLPWFQGNHEHVISLIGKLQGNESSSVINPLQRIAMWLSKDRLAMAAKRLRLLKLDYGDAFDIEYKETEGVESKIRISTCFYGEFFGDEGAPELTRACCCSVDKNWFECIEDDQIRFLMSSSIAEGDSSCQMVIKRESN